MVNSIWGILIMLLMPILFYTLVVLCVKESFWQVDYPKLTIKDSFLVLFIFIMMILWVCVVINKNNFIYFWDYGREWKSAILVKDSLVYNPIGALKSIYWSINNEDYNQFMPMLISLPIYLIGASFKRYVVLVEIFYMIPAVIVMSLLIYKILIILKLDKVRFPVLVLCICLTPILHYVMFDGFMDSPVLMIVSCTWLMSVDWNYEKFSIKKSILTALTLTLLVVFRRHFAYYVVGYLVSQMLVVILQIYEGSKTDNIQLIKGYIQNMSIIGIISIVILVAFFRNFLIRSVFNDFSIAYKAYDVTLKEKFARIPEVFGWAVLILAFICPVLYSVKRRTVIKIIVPLYVNIIVTTGLLWRVLQMNYHQYYLILVPALVLEFVGVFGVASLIHRENSIKYASIFIVIISSINICTMFAPQLRNVPGREAFTTLHYSPKTRNDIGEINRLVYDINIIEQKDSNNHLYTLASSGILNYNILSMSQLPEKTNAVPQMYPTHDVDLRDGFPEGFLNANYVIVANPIQAHLPEGTQEVVRYLASQVMDSGTTIGKYYQLEKEYYLDNAVTVGLYRRNCELGRDAYEELNAYYGALYPDSPQLFSDRLKYEDPFFPSELGKRLVLTTKSGVLSSQFNTNTEALTSEREGFLVYGPYKRIERGHYSIEYCIRGNDILNDDIGYVDIYTNGKTILQKSIKGGSNVIRIDDVWIDDTYDDIELRIFVTIPGIEFNKITITRR